MSWMTILAKKKTLRKTQKMTTYWTTKQC